MKRIENCDVLEMTFMVDGAIHSGLDSKWLGALLKKNFHDAKPVEVVNVAAESAVPKGDNYSSDVWRVKLTTITASGSTKTFSFIVKKERVSLNEAAHSLMRDLSVFRTEINIYKNVLAPMEQLMNEFDDKRETLWAKLYGFHPYKNMVLEDLKEQNYVLIDRRNWQDLDHSLLVLRNVGRYHAMAKVLIKRGILGEDDKHHRFWASHGHPMKNKLIPGGLNTFAKILLRKVGPWKSGWEEIGKRLQSKSADLVNQIADICDNYDKKFEVFNHGDLWSSNMMFKKMEYTDLPVSVKFVDYQVPHLNSFIWDVTYFMYSSVKPSVRRVHRDQLLSAYQQSLSANLKFFNYDDYIPSLEDIMSEDARMSPVKLAILLTLMPITTTSKDNAFDLNKLFSDNPEEAFNEDIFTEKKFASETGEDLIEFARLGIF